MPQLPLLMLTISAWLFSTLQVKSQDLFLFSSAGNSTASGNLYLSQSIGEPCIQEIQSGNNWITEGFQQPGKIQLMVATDETENATKILVFPNPASSMISIRGLEINQQFDVNLINPLGQTIFTKLYNGNEIINIWFEHLPTGLYLLQIKSQASTLFTQSILKI